MPSSSILGPEQSSLLADWSLKTKNVCCHTASSRQKTLEHGAFKVQHKRESKKTVGGKQVAVKLGEGELREGFEGGEGDA